MNLKMYTVYVKIQEISCEVDNMECYDCFLTLLLQVYTNSLMWIIILMRTIIIVLFRIFIIVLFRPSDIGESYGNIN